MKNEELVSVIVPIYNVDKYLRKCLDTIISQTYSNLEIILVNDGSTDLSYDICQEFKKKDTRIILINQENSGLSVARNVGVKASHGKYIGFVDSDDYLYLNMYESLVTALESKSADIAECMVEDVIEDKNVGIRTDTISYYEMRGKDALSKLMQNEKGIRPRYAVWSKLFKSDIIKDLEFPSGEIHEDYFYDALALLRAEKYVIISSKLYCYRSRQNSITSAPFNIKDFDKIKHIFQRTQYLKDNGYEDLSIISQRSGYETLLHYYFRAHQVGMPDECLAIKKALFKERDNIKKCEVRNIRKMEFFFFYFNPIIYVTYMRVKIKLYTLIKKK